MVGSNKIKLSIVISVYSETFSLVETVDRLIAKKQFVENIEFCFYAKGRPESLEMDKELLLFRAPAAECALLRWKA